MTPTADDADEATQAAATTAQPEANEPRRASKAKKETGPKKLSAIDAAAKVLAEDGGALNCQEMIDAMAKKGYWTYLAARRQRLLCTPQYSGR